MKSKPRSRRFPALALAAVTAVISIGGCGTDGPLQAGAAVIIEGERVTVGEIQDKVEAIVAERDRVNVLLQAAGQEPLQAVDSTLESRQQIQRLIVHRILENAGAVHGVTVTESEIDDELATLEEQFGSADAFAQQIAAASIAPGDLRTFVGDSILQTKLGEALVPNAATDEELSQRQDEVNNLLITTATELHVTVNPRFGAFDPSTGQVVQAEDPAIGPVESR